MSEHMTTKPVRPDIDIILSLIKYIKWLENENERLYGYTVKVRNE